MNAAAERAKIIIKLIKQRSRLRESIKANAADEYSRLLLDKNQNTLKLYNAIKY